MAEYPRIDVAVGVREFDPVFTGPDWVGEAAGGDAARRVELERAALGCYQAEVVFRVREGLRSAFPRAEVDVWVDPSLVGVEVWLTPNGVPFSDEEGRRAGEVAAREEDGAYEWLFGQVPRLVAEAQRRWEG